MLLLKQKLVDLWPDHKAKAHDKREFHWWTLLRAGPKEHCQRKQNHDQKSQQEKPFQRHHQKPTRAHFAEDDEDGGEVLFGEDESADDDEEAAHGTSQTEMKKPMRPR